MIDDSFVRHNLVLEAKVLTEAPTAAYLAEMLETMWNEWLIGRDQVHIVLRDGARSMQKMMELAGASDEWCLSHVLQVIYY